MHEQDHVVLTGLRRPGRERSRGPADQAVVFLDREAAVMLISGTVFQRTPQIGQPQHAVRKNFAPERK
nr:hypothetical protein [Kribbella monticola]